MGLEERVRFEIECDTCGGRARLRKTGNHKLVYRCIDCDAKYTKVHVSDTDIRYAESLLSGIRSDKLGA